MSSTNISYLLDKISSLLKREERYTNACMKERQRFFVYVCGSIILFIAVPLNLLGFTGPSSNVFFWMNSANLTAGIITFLLYSLKKIKLKQALSALLITNQLEIAGEMLHCALYPSTYHMQLIIGDIVLSSILILFSVFAYMRILPSIISIICMGMYTACTIITGDSTLRNFYLLFLIIFIVICIIGEQLIHAATKLQEENLNLKQEEAEMLNTLRLNKMQIKAYIELSKLQHNSSEDTEQLLELIGKRPQRNIINAVSTYLTEKQTNINRIAQYFPELTPSELEISRLILQGKKLGEICEILGKSENNITAHRGHIRKKLNLQTNQNLKQALEMRISIGETASEASD